MNKKSNTKLFVGAMVVMALIVGVIIVVAVVQRNDNLHRADAAFDYMETSYALTHPPR